LKLKTENPLLLVPFRFGLIGALMNILALLVPYYLGRHPLLLNIVLDPIPATGFLQQYIHLAMQQLMLTFRLTIF